MTVPAHCAAAEDPRPSRLSAVADGEGDAAELDAVLAAWRREPEVCERWHTYALIGDVLRSDDLGGQGAGHDAAFLNKLRGRLAAEPVVLAPAPLAARPALSAVRRWRRLSAPVAMAAGVLTVAGVAVMMRGQGTVDAGEATLAQGAVPAQVQTVAMGTLDARAVPASAATLGDRIVRDAVLDRYLEAHRQRSRGAVMVMPADDGLRQVGVAGR